MDTRQKLFLHPTQQQTQHNIFLKQYKTDVRCFLRTLNERVRIISKSRANRQQIEVCVYFYRPHT